jgi:hypothetical protein
MWKRQLYEDSSNRYSTANERRQSFAVFHLLCYICCSLCLRHDEKLVEKHFDKAVTFNQRLDLKELIKVLLN